MHTVNCAKLNKEAEGLDYVPHPGDLGMRIYENISQEAWAMWVDQLKIIMNENRLITADPSCFPVVEKFMMAYFFKEGDYADMTF